MGTSGPKSWMIVLAILVAVAIALVGRLGMGMAMLLGRLAVPAAIMYFGYRVAKSLFATSLPPSARGTPLSRGQSNAYRKDETVIDICSVCGEPISGNSRKHVCMV